MSPGEQTASFALLSVLFFVISLFADDEDWFPSVCCTGLLVSYWAFNTILWMLSVVEDLSLASDVVFACGAVALLTILRRGWLIGLAALFVLNVVLDLWHAQGSLDYQQWAEAGNVTFVAQLAMASLPGLSAIVRKVLPVSREA